MSIQLQLEGIAPHQVYQRGDDNTASIRFSAQLTETVAGRLEARTVALPWKAVGIADAGTHSILLEPVPVGEHRVFVRVVSNDGQILAEAEAGPVFVGDLWLLAGQSNMDGYGKLIDVDEPGHGVSCFFYGNRWGIAQDPLCSLMESVYPVHWHVKGDRQEILHAIQRDRVHGGGLGVPFGKYMLEQTGIPIGLIMASHGGTSMSEWDPARAGEGGNSLYGAMLKIVQEVGGKVKGCLWYQGESDAMPGKAEHYYERMKQLISSLREDLGDPRLPFIYAQLSVVLNWKTGAEWNQVQNDQLRLENELERLAVVPTIDAALSDAIHVSTESLRVIGRRMGLAALRLAHGRHAIESGPRLCGTSWNEERTQLTLRFTGINGSLKPVERVFAFQVRAGEELLPLRGRLTDDRRAIVLELEKPAPQQCALWHGKGTNPPVNVKDERGFPLPVFGPVFI